MFVGSTPMKPANMILQNLQKHETLIEENLETILPVENPETDECKGE